MTTEATVEFYPAPVPPFAQYEQFMRIKQTVEKKMREELYDAYFGTMADSGKALTPFQLAEIAASTARAAVLNVFAADGDARDA